MTTNRTYSKDDWMSAKEAAPLLGVSHNTVLRSLRTDERADYFWGPGNWFQHPLKTYRVILLRRTRVEEMASTMWGGTHAA